MGVGALGEDIEYERCSVHDPNTQLSLQLLLGVRAQLVVEDHHVGAGVLGYRQELFQLSLAHVVARIRLGQLLGDPGHSRDVHACRQLLQLVERPANVDPGIGKLDPNQYGLLRFPPRRMETPTLLLLMLLLDIDTSSQILPACGPQFPCRTITILLPLQPQVPQPAHRLFKPVIWRGEGNPVEAFTRRAESHARRNPYSDLIQHLQ